MDRAIVVVDGTDQNRSLLREAVALTTAVGAEVILLGLGSTDSLEDDTEVLEAISDIEGTAATDETILEGLEGETNRFVRETLGSLPDKSTTVAVLAENEASAIIDTAEEYDCDHIFITGRKRSPTGKVVFGDRTQKVLLNFEGNITVSLN